MDKQPRNLDFVPTEFVGRHNTGGNYVLRSPGGVLPLDPEACAGVMAAAAKIAHSDAVRIFSLPGSHKERIHGIKGLLKRFGFEGEVTFKELPDHDIQIKGLLIDGICMDGRQYSALPDEAKAKLAAFMRGMASEYGEAALGDVVNYYPKARGRVKFPAGVALWHPEIRDKLPELYQRYIDATILLMQQSRMQFDRIIGHVGIGDEPGCGGIAMARQVLGGDEKIPDIDREIVLMKEVRQSLSRKGIVAANCRILMDVIKPNGQGKNFTRLAPHEFKRDENGKIFHPDGKINL